MDNFYQSCWNTQVRITITGEGDFGPRFIQSAWNETFFNSGYRFTHFHHRDCTRISGSVEEDITGFPQEYGFTKKKRAGKTETGYKKEYLNSLLYKAERVRIIR